MAKNSRLTDKQKLFVEYYLQTWNATEAARRATYKGNDQTLAVVGYDNLRKPKIREHIEKRLQEVTISANEVLMRLSDQATASISDFAEAVGNIFIVDMEAVRAKGHLVKKIKYTKSGVEIELHDSQSALVHLGKHYKLFTDRIELVAWREEVKDAGGDPAVLFEEMVKHFMSLQSDAE